MHAGLLRAWRGERVERAGPGGVVGRYVQVVARRCPGIRVAAAIVVMVWSELEFVLEGKTKAFVRRNSTVSPFSLCLLLPCFGLV